MIFLGSFLLFHLAAIAPILTETVYDVTKYGADNKARSLMTTAVQKAIDNAASVGGGTIYFPPGQYISGPIKLRSNINVHFADNVTITWSHNEKYYPAMKVKTAAGGHNLDHTPLIYSVGEKNITIRGKGILDGQGSFWWSKFRNQERPHIMFFFDNKNIRLEDFTLKNSPNMNLNPVHCEDILIRGITISNPYDSHNTDGINCYSCRNLHISGVSISTGDDCVVLDAGPGRSAHNIVITDSHMMLGHSGVGIGSAIRGGLHNITVTNCVFDGTDRGLYIKSRRGRGGIVENIHYKNITMHNIKKEGICLNMLYDGEHQDAALHNRDIQWEPFGPQTPVYRNILYERVRGDAVKNPIFFVGLPESHITDIRMNEIDVKSSQQIFLNNTKNVEINGKKQPDHFY